ncbi:hypothetical protein [Saccharibacillus sacchari]|uniref:Uncharacterized protein n=1 Tax=Saccharibacillus sacchari TaxID=456493 RepID=A0ACC6PGV5_9BACL
MTISSLFRSSKNITNGCKPTGIDTDYIQLPFADHATNTVYPNGVGYEMLGQLTLRWFNKYGSGI